MRLLPLASVLIMLALGASASHETMNPLAGVLPSGSDPVGWDYAFTEQGWQARNTRKADNYRSFRYFAVPEFILREHPRPYMWTVKVRVQGDPKLDRDDGHIGAGIILDAGTKGRGWMTILLRLNGEVRVGEIRGRAFSYILSKKDIFKSGEEVTFVVAEREDGRMVTVNDQPVGLFKAEEGGLGGQPAIFVAGAGIFNFRQFEMRNKDGPVIWKPKNQGHGQPPVRR